jgi:hypothetical protein
MFVALRYISFRKGILAAAGRVQLRYRLGSSTPHKLGIETDQNVCLPVLAFRPRPYIGIDPGTRIL